MLCEAVLQRPAGLTDVDFGAVSTRNPVDYTSSLRCRGFVSVNSTDEGPGLDRNVWNLF